MTTEVLKGVIKSFNSGTYKASVQIVGSLAVWLEDVPVARNIPSAEVVVERECGIAFFDESNPNDAVVVSINSGTPSPSTQHIVNRKTANQTHTTTSLTDVSELNLSVGANEIWAFQLFIIASGPAGSMDMGLAFSWPSGATVIWGVHGPTWNTTTDVNDDTNFSAEAHDTSDGALRLGIAGTTQAAFNTFLIAGTIVNGANAGTLQLRFREWQSNATGVTIRANSWLIAHRLA